jgi:uncharacterized protein YndB with AHSA1/START domain
MPTIVKSELFIKATSKQVYYALTHATALHEWLCDLATVAPRPGGRMYLWWHGDFFSAGEYLTLKENRSVKFKWYGRSDPGSSEVEFELTPKEEGTVVKIFHSVPEGEDWKQRAEDFKAQWSVSLQNLASVLETGFDKRTFDRPMLGINISDFNPEIAKTLHVPVDQGMRIDDVRPGMGAHSAGLCKDDILVEMNRKPITNDYGSLVTALAGKKGGDIVDVVYYRGPRQFTVQMELSRRPTPEITWEPKELSKLVRSKYDESIGKLESCFKDVSESAADHEPAPGEWSAKQTLAHLLLTERSLIANLDDSVGGYERISDDWGGNIPAHINSVVSSYGTARNMLDDLRRLSNEIVSFIAALPKSFIERKASYFLSAWQILEYESHTISHIDQIIAAIKSANE